jgi:hypothetical protein
MVSEPTPQRAFFVWTMFGMAAFPLGVTLAAIEMQQPEPSPSRPGCF